MNECCPNNDLYITNKDYYSTNIEATNGNIYAGDCYFYATANLNCGAVKINPGSNVKYIGKTINLGNGFTVLQGSVFTAIASEDCRYESVFKIAKRERFTSNNSDNKLLENNDVIISPNPSNGIFNVRAIHSTVISIKVFNIYGQEVRSCNNSLASLIDLTDVADELYMYKILLSDGSIVVGRLIKKA